MARRKNYYSSSNRIDKDGMAVFEVILKVLIALVVIVFNFFVELCKSIYKSIKK